MAEAEDPLGPNRDSREPEAPRFLEEAEREAPEAGRRAEPRFRFPDYAGATPEDIVADIERTRAHMDETLLLLGRRLRPVLPGKLAMSLAGLLALTGLAYLGYKGFLGFRFRHSLRGRLIRSAGLENLGRRAAPRPKFRKASMVEQSLLAARVAMSLRKGKPTIVVVEPRR